MIADFFKPNEDRRAMEKLEAESVSLMMKNSSTSFGMSGGYFDLPPEVKRKYAIPNIG